MKLLMEYTGLFDYDVKNYFRHSLQGAVYTVKIDCFYFWNYILAATTDF